MVPEGAEQELILLLLRPHQPPAGHRARPRDGEGMKNAFGPGPRVARLSSDQQLKHNNPDTIKHFLVSYLPPDV